MKKPRPTYLQAVYINRSFYFNDGLLFAEFPSPYARHMRTIAITPSTPGILYKKITYTGNQSIPNKTYVMELFRKYKCDGVCTPYSHIKTSNFYIGVVFYNAFIRHVCVIPDTIFDSMEFF